MVPTSAKSPFLVSLDWLLYWTGPLQGFLLWNFLNDRIRKNAFNSSLRILATCRMTIDFLLPLGQTLYPLVTSDVYNVYYTSGFSQGSLLRHNLSFIVSPVVLRRELCNTPGLWELRSVHFITSRTMKIPYSWVVCRVRESLHHEVLNIGFSL